MTPAQFEKAKRLAEAVTKARQLRDLAEQAVAMTERHLAEFHQQNGDRKP